jgi:hypothetical protein
VPRFDFCVAFLLSFLLFDLKRVPLRWVVTDLEDALLLD